jgi:hypothetical protein
MFSFRRMVYCNAVVMINSINTIALHQCSPVIMCIIQVYCGYKHWEPVQ